MKSLLCLIILAVGSLIGCSENKITIENRAAAGVYFTFRGERTYVEASRTAVVSEPPPNGSFEFGTTFEVPSGINFTSVSATDENGTLDFSQNKTQVLILYGSAITRDSSGNGTYSLNCNVSTSNSANTATTAP